MPDDSKEITQVRRFLKERLQRDYTTFYGHYAERDNVKQLLEQTVEHAESNSMLLMGPRGVGKTTLINSVLTDLMAGANFRENCIIVHLDGHLHTDDRLALKSITVQMQLENVANGQVFSSFAENLSFLLAALKAGSKQSKSIIFILEEFDLFCAHHNQTLLYNLLDISQSAQTPICVLGVTCRLDVIELLEKRVKSRFSHRQVFLFPEADDFNGYVRHFQHLLSIPTEAELKKITERLLPLWEFDATSMIFHRNHFNPIRYKIQRKFAETWNKNVAALMQENTVVIALQALFDFDVSEAYLKSFLFRLVAQVSVHTMPFLTIESVTALVATCAIDQKVELLCGLSVLELCLVIAIKQHSEIYDRDPFNFEVIFARFSKFAKISSTMQGIERPVVLKAFEHLRNIELILPLSASTSKVQKEFEMHRLALTYNQVTQAVHKYQALPTEVSQWAQSSIL